MTAPIPLSQMGLDTYCPRCFAVIGMRCHSASGRTLSETHLDRMRAALNAEPMRKWLDERRQWATG